MSSNVVMRALMGFRNLAKLQPFFQELPFKKIQHIVSTSDAHPVIGVDNNEAVFILVMGQLKVRVQKPMY